MKKINELCKKKYSIISLAIILLLIIGVSFAWFTITLNGSGIQILKAGTLKVELSDCELLLEDTIPQSATDGLQNTACHFEVQNTGKVDAAYTVYLDDDDLASTETRMEDDFVRYSLVTTGEEETAAKTKILSTTGTNPERVLVTGNVEAGTTIGYDLKLWIDSKATNDVMKTIFDGVLRVEVGQKQRKKYRATQLNSISRSSTKIIFQDKIAEPELSDGSNLVGTYDISVNQDGTVLQHVVTNGNEMITYVQANGDILAPPDSNNYFMGSGLVTIEGLEYFDTSEVTNMYGMFSGQQNLKELDLSHFNTSNVTNMSYMFSYLNSLTSIDISNFDTSNVTNMSYMFAYSPGIERINMKDLDTSNVTNMSYMFSGDNKITSFEFGDWDTSNVTDMTQMFSSCNSIKELDATFIDTDSLTRQDYMFDMNGIEKLDISGLRILNGSGILPGYGTLKTLTAKNTTFYTYGPSIPIPSSLEYVNMSHVNFPNLEEFNSTSLSWLEKLKTIDLSYMNAPNLTKISYFYGIVSKELESIKIGHNNTPKLTNLGYAFSGINNTPNLTTIDFSDFDTSTVTNMERMFSESKSLKTIDLSKLDFSNVENMGYMFDSASELTSIDLSSLKGEKLTNIRYAFSGCVNLKDLKISKLQGGTSVDMASMFYNASSLETLDISNMVLNPDTSSYMLDGATSLKTIYTKDETSKSLIDVAITNAGISATSVIK